MTNDLKEKIARAIYEARDGSGCKSWSLLTRAHRLPYIMDGQSALRAIEEAGYVVVKRQPVEQPQMGYLLSSVQGDSRSYADRADGATSFDGELQFEIDRAKEGL